MSDYRFPYRPRPHQVEVAHEIRKALKRVNVVLEAPTGFGKTPVVIYALLPYIERGNRVIWAVRTGNETDRPVEELSTFRKEIGLKLVGLGYRGKKDMCLLAKKLGGELDYAEVAYICSRERKKCEFYQRLEEGVDVNHLMSKGALTHYEVYRAAEELGLCPYFLQRKLLSYADIVALSYNYIVDEELAWSLKSVIPFSNSILVVDEAHNLQNLNLGGDSITEGTLSRAIGEAREVNSEEALELVRHAQNIIEEKFSSVREEEPELFDPASLVPEEKNWLIQAAVKAGESIRELRYRQGLRPRSSLYHFARFLENALSLRGTKGVAFIVERLEERLSLSIWDMRSAEILGEVWKKFKRVIFMSGTLSPIEAFAETVGLENYYAVNAPSPYDETNASVYLVRDLSTRGEELSEEMAMKYVNGILRLLSRVRKNSAVFTASYRIQGDLVNAGLKRKAEEIGYEVFIERREMSSLEASEVLKSFKALAAEGRGLIVAPMGGRFAEGADYPGGELMCVFLAGIPFEKPTTKTALYISYYTELYGEEKGKLYAYVYPAVRKAAQALGRALRSPRDQAVLVLGDYRYRNYAALLPDYVRELVTETSYECLDGVRLPWEQVKYL
ncbi:MAG: ATP-dependent DNA helicase [Thermofilaceae archaeon]